MNEKVKYTEEWGGNVRFPEPECVTMTDLEGKEMMCKCGKRATFIVVGKEAYIAICVECSPYGGKPA